MNLIVIATTLLIFQQDSLPGLNSHDLPATEHLRQVIAKANHKNELEGISMKPGADTVLDGPQQAGVFFGATISNAGDVNKDGYTDVIIASPYFGDEITGGGRVWIYYGSANGLREMPDQTLSFHSNVDGNESFDFSASGAGDINKDGYSDIVIGAHRAGDGAEAFSGRVLVYYGSDSGIHSSPDKILVPEMGGSSFGFCVSGGGDINGDGFSDVSIGAPSYGYLNSQQDFYGRVYVYYGSATGLSDNAGSYIDGEIVRGYFGYLIRNIGDINADGYSDIAVSEDGVSEDYWRLGVVKIYLGSAAGLVTASANRFSILPNGNFTGFGRSMAAGGDINGDGFADLVINQPWYQYNIQMPGGSTWYTIPRIWVCYGSATGFSSTPVIVSLAATGLTDETRICNAGDLNGDGYADICVAGNYYDSLTGVKTGRTVTYYGSQAGIKDSGFVCGDFNDLYAGLQIAAAGDINGDGYADLLAGAPGYSSGVNENMGRVYVRHGAPGDTRSDDSALTFLSPGYSAMGFGRSLSDAGDINGDGFADIIIGDPEYIIAHPVRDGAAYIYYGNTEGVPVIPDVSLKTSDRNCKFAFAVTKAGDINGDGYDDVMVGEPEFDTDHGKIFIYQGAATGLKTSPVTLTGAEAQTSLGFAIAAAGDLNGDGFDDVIASAFNSITVIDTGKVFVYYGSSRGLPARPSAVLRGMNESAASGFGRSLSGAGDLNGDGFDDVIVGSSQGKAYVFYGSANGLLPLPFLISVAVNPDLLQGCRVARAGDIDADGFSDVLIWTMDPVTGRGVVSVFNGSATGIKDKPDASLFGITPGFNLEDVMHGGDVNSDGYADVLVRANLYTGPGMVLIYKGSPAGLCDPDTLRNPVNDPAGGFGHGFSAAGDVNGDGFTDVLAGESFAIDQKGRVYLFFGGGKQGYRNNLRLYNKDLVAPLGESNLKKNKFGAGLFAKSSQGLQKGKLVWETRNAGTPFYGSPITTSTFYSGSLKHFSDLGLKGIELKNEISKTNKTTYLRARVEYDPVTAATGQRFSPWRYSSKNSRSEARHFPDPLSLPRFTAEKQGQDVLLNWSTGGFGERVLYIVERSMNNRDFRELCKIRAHRYSNEYRWLDEHPSSGKNFYRIKAVDGASINYSKVLVVEFKMPGRCIVYPNPVGTGQQLTIRISPAPGMVTVKLYDVRKKLVLQQSVNAGAEIFSIRIPKVMPGLYWLTIRSGDDDFNRPVLIYAR